MALWRGSPGRHSVKTLRKFALRPRSEGALRRRSANALHKGTPRRRFAKTLHDGALRMLSAKGFYESAIGSFGKKHCEGAQALWDYFSVAMLQKALHKKS